LGVLTGQPEAIDRIRSSRVYCPIDVFSLCLLKEMLSRGGGRPLGNITKLIDIRSKTQKSLRDLGLKVPDSRTNFLVAFIGDARGAVAFFRENSILVKDLEKDGMPGWLRITVGSAQDMKKFVAIARAFQQNAQLSIRKTQI
jgi:histidinol-phosphate/aromatic aminotransferase/cobyric acid decarboxylase-like protein